MANTTTAAHFHLWRSAHPMTRVFQTPWPCVPLALSYEVAVPSASYLANDYAGAAVPSFYSAVIGNPDPSKYHSTL